jgi:ABC-type uncharacterized transport system permease subunit
VAHTAALWTLGVGLERCPLGTVPEILSVLSWSVILIYLAVYWRYRLDVLHVVILPLVLVVQFVSGLLPEDVIPVAAPLRPSLLRFHLTVIIFAVAALFITFAASLAYVLLDRALKAKRPQRLIPKLPSLIQCDTVGRVSLLWAFPLLTLGIITGATVSASINRTFWTWQAKETLAVMAWVILAVVLILRLGWGWRGRNAALLTIVAFFAVLLRMMGVY